METIQLNWKKKQQGWVLFDGVSELVVIEKMEVSKVFYKIDHKAFNLVGPCFWGKWKSSDQNGDSVFKLDFSFWGSTANVLFTNGNQFKLKYRNNPMLEIEISDNARNPLFSYLRTNPVNTSQQIQLVLKHSGSFTNDLLHLLALGFGMMSTYLHPNLDDSSIMLITMTS